MRVGLPHRGAEGLYAPRRILDTTQSFQEFGFHALTGFREGLIKTIGWYKKDK
ncbi:MAG: hypothetical protein ACYC5X_13850 [Syntrophales bacterium]